MAGGNAQRSGFVDAECPLTEPNIYWQRSLGVRGESNLQPIINEQGNVYVSGSPVNYNLWKYSDEKRTSTLYVILILVLCYICIDE